MGLMTATATAVIANGGSLSAAIYVGDKIPSAITMPAAWTAADLTFQASDDNVTYYELQDASGQAITLASPAAAGRYQLDPSDFLSVTYLKIRSGTLGSPVAQGAARSLVILNRKFYARH